MNERQDKRRKGAEEIDLNQEEEEALERAWAKLDQEKKEPGKKRKGDGSPPPKKRTT